ncbi:glyoxalase [Sphingobium sp. Leaf26]|nr:glyoxalase [Sphingobium sp. Leaf26]
MALARARDVAFVRFRVPDLEVMRSFLEDFGMVVAGQDENALFMRGHGTAPFLHVSERGEAGFIGFGIWIDDEGEFEQLARSEGLSPEQSIEPGGGRILRLTDPDGYQVEVLCGQRAVDPLPVPEHVPWNQGSTYPRTAFPRRVGRRPSHVLRLGHVVVAVTSFATSEAWYKDRFGFLTSDEIRPTPQAPAMGAFMRCDRGEDTCDHHTLFLVERPGGPGFIHSAFEVADLDDLMAGHEHLKATGRDHFWGVGRHLLGSQVFDYWKDPWGHEIEHWTDGDQLPAVHEAGAGSIEDLLGVQWGMKMPGGLG